MHIYLTIIIIVLIVISLNEFDGRFQKNSWIAKNLKCLGPEHVKEKRTYR